MRFNLWVSKDDHCKIVCHGEQGEMTDLALLAGIQEDIYVLPDGQEPADVLAIRTASHA